MKTHDELNAALESKDAALSNAKHQLADIGDVQLAVPTSLLDDLAQLAKTQPEQITGAIRA